jgi:hypothetical protein
VTGAPFMPEDFVPPSGLVTPDVVLEPLGPEHNERDYAAWTSSMEHIHATPGFRDEDHDTPAPEGGRWPRPMTLEQNLGDLVRHAADFAARRGFTFTVLDPDSHDVIGCLYIYPERDGVHDAIVESWVRASRAELDPVLWLTVTAWLADAWPFTNPRYAPR